MIPVSRLLRPIDRPLRRLHVTLDLGTISRGVPVRFQRLVDVTTAFLHAIEDYTEPLEERMSGEFLPFMPAVDQSLEEPARLREVGSAWLLGRAMTEALAILDAPLQKAYEACLWIERTVPGERDRQGLEHGIRDEGVAFRALPLPARIRRFRSRFGPALIPEEGGTLPSLVRVRECLIRRAGVVAEEDCDGPDGLIVRWWRTGVWILDGTREMRMERSGRIPAGARVELRPEVGSRTFEPGSRVELTPFELTEICWSLTRFTFHLEERVRTFFRDRAQLRKH